MRISRICLNLCSVLLIGASLVSCGGKSTEPESILSMPKHSEEKLFDQAIEAYEEELYSVSKQKLQALISGYPASPRAEFAKLKIADCDFFSGDYPEAAEAYSLFRP